MGTALNEILSPVYTVVGKNSKDFDAFDFQQARQLIEQVSPDIVINTVSFVGVDACEKEPQKAYQLNTLFPKFLAELSNEKKFLLIHFSTDAVFHDRGEGFYTEDDCARPVNTYGFTKYGGDCFVEALAKAWYIIRISVLFGESPKHAQFVEKMLQKIREGAGLLRISGDIIASPTYNLDVAREIKRIIEAGTPPGLYHVVNEGRASLYELMREITALLQLDVKIEKASYKDFPSIGRKNTCTPIRSNKLKPLRPWQEAIREYCGRLKKF